MKLNTLLFTTLILIFSQTAFTQNFEWVRQFAGASYGAGEYIESALDNAGNVYTTGYFEGTMDFDPDTTAVFNLTSLGGKDIFISKLDAAGNFIWAKNMGGIEDDKANSITVDDNGNIYTTGFFRDTVDFDTGSGLFELFSAGSRDIFITKHDALGNFVWVKQIAGVSGESGESITYSNQGNIYLTGSFSGADSVDFDPGAGVYNLIPYTGSQDAFVLKLDTLGDFIWANQFGNTGSEEGYGITVDATGNVYTSGNFEGTVYFNPGVSLDSLTSFGGRDVFVSKLGASGNFIWAKHFGGSLDDQSFAIKLDNTGNVFTTGYFQETVDFDPGTSVDSLTSFGVQDIFITKLDGFGNYLWTKQIGGADFDIGLSLDIDASGNVYTAGAFQSTVDFDPGNNSFNFTALNGFNAFISKLDGAGNFVWAKQFGGVAGGSGAYSVVLDAAENIYTTGTFGGTIDFNSDTTGVFNLTSNSIANVFVHKMGVTTTQLSENYNTQHIRYYPNPTNGQLIIENERNFEDDRVVIYNSLGQAIFNQKYTETNNLTLNINGPSGVYFIELYDKSNRAMLRVMKK
jgi:hypothetical protein